jgi:hypothetical protein
VWAAGANLTLLWRTLGWQSEGRALHYGRNNLESCEVLATRKLIAEKGELKPPFGASGVVERVVGVLALHLSYLHDLPQGLHIPKAPGA